MKAIVVDDSRTIRIMLKRFLTEQGFDTLFEAGDGREALAKLKEVGAVDLALVDWNMPTMDGFELLTAIREDSAFAAMKIMMVTTEAEAAQVARATSAGANAYITKPFNTEGLRGKLDAMGLHKP